MDIKITTNFSFSKLLSEIKSIKKDFAKQFAKNAEKVSKANIDSGQLAPLKESTKKWRKREGFPTSPPLKASGKMYDSIKAEDNKLSVLKYGKYHNDGKVPTTVARPFISGLSITNIEEVDKMKKKLVQDINKALKK